MLIHFFCFWPHCMTCGILVHWPGIKPAQCLCTFEWDAYSHTLVNNIIKSFNGWERGSRGRRYMFMWLSGKESTFQCRRRKRRGFDPWVRKSPWRRKWQSAPVSLPGKSMDRGAWWATDRGVAKSWTRLSTHTHDIKNDAYKSNSSCLAV